MKVEKVTCEGPIVKQEDGVNVFTGQRVQIVVDTGRRSSCYKSYLGYKVSVFDKMTITETIYDEGSFPENGTNKVIQNIVGKYVKSLIIENYRPELGTESIVDSSRDNTVIGSYTSNFVSNMDYLTNSYKGTDGERTTRPTFRSANLDCRTEY